MRRALIIVDMQCGSFVETPRHDAEGLVARIEALAQRLRSDGDLVVFIQHEGPLGDNHHPGEPGWLLLPGLSVAEEDVVIPKTACDAFLNTQLEAVLVAEGVTELIVTGCATDYCVDTTVRAALGRGYRTMVPRDGHTTADRPHLRAIQIIAHHNAIWADFLSPAGPAILTTCDSLMDGAKVR